MKKTLSILLVLIFISITSFSQQNFLLKVSGDVLIPQTLTLENLHLFPKIEVNFIDKVGNKHVYGGYSIQSILTKAGATMGTNLRGKNLSKYVIAKCADGYKVLFSLAELDSNFTDRVVIIADEMDGKVLPKEKGPLRIIVPDEKKPARSCFQLVELIVKTDND
ncbi:molybdopterin-dependent oxidoreductase [Rhizosphaericola mali]|uniref:Molybdopterin-dependent oxidoreductase n=1 Tax=Rhizosphaericola mali TaxID=2545455 RepID=A0A5P2FY23_9BACT|nr:molybdopterin-dependent oxidoreductase [Rhizosphaericola mali]QES88396.1 molybdopterin-dependent oxidoreductase [Rhizosphaericola mali]